MQRTVSIRRLLRQSTVVLFNDDEHFNRNITGVKSLTDIKDWFQIKGSLIKTCAVGNRVHYRLKGSGYSFSLILL